MGRYIDPITNKATPLSATGMGNPMFPGMLTPEEMKKNRKAGCKYEDYMKIINDRPGSGDR